MSAPLGLTDIFPAFALGGVALLNLMARLAPPAPIRWGVVGALASLLTLYLLGQIGLYLPERIGVPLYAILVAFFASVIWWNWHDERSAKRG